MNDLDLVELLDVLDTRELSLLAIAFDNISLVRNRDAATFGAWWRWRVLQALGEQHDQPDYLALVEMDGPVLEALRREFLWLAENHLDDDRLCDFAAAMVAQIALAQLEREADRQDSGDRLQAYIDEQRRVRPHGTHVDSTEGFPSWPEVSGPPTGDAP
jgi:hypothetical protein